MGQFLFAVLVIAGVVIYFMTPDERTRLFRAGVRAGVDGFPKVRTAAFGDPDREEFLHALLERTPWVLVTPLFLALNIGVFILMLFAPGSFSDPQTLMAWGGSFGPHTTNGEWWRLVTSMFVHTGMIHLLITSVCLAQVGAVLERLVGRSAFLASYLGAGILASLLNLAIYPMGVSVGSSSAIFGIYGLFLAAFIWGVRSSSNVAIPLAALKRMGPPAGVFVLYNMAGGGLGILPHVFGLLVGLIHGIVLAKAVGERKPAARPLAGVATATAVLVAIFAVPLRGIDDVRPEISKLSTVEERTAGAYESALDKYRKGRISVAELAALIDRTIIPELKAADARLRSYDRVPSEHRPLVAAGEKYLRLRDESWRLRADGLRKMIVLKQESRRVQAIGLHNASVLTLRKAESAERASLVALKELTPPAE